MSANTSRTRFTERARDAALWLRDTGLGGFGFALVLVVAVAGWAASFIGLHRFGMDHMGLSDTTAWLVPITFDGAPAGLSIVVARAATHGRPATVWRLLIVAFTGLSSWINYQHIDDPLGRIVASLMPPSAVILFEGLMSESRAAAARRNGRTAPSLHPMRWVFDFGGTWSILRDYVLGSELPEPLQQAAAAALPERSGSPAQGAPAAAPRASQSAPAPALAAAPRASQSAPVPALAAAPRASQSAPVPAPVSLTKAPQGAPTPAVAPAPVSLRKAPPTAAQSAPARAPKAPPAGPGSASNAAAKAPRKRPGKVSRNDAKDALRALYDELGRRPLESELVKRLESIKYKYTSRQHANRLRSEIETKEPHLVALGSTNVRALTGP